ncbi:MAG: hypothetical protein IKR18_02085, partial [Bacteroidaceae bacterium]|nr:hypothetical protein [Bacteroidaceae bacterium]
IESIKEGKIIFNRLIQDNDNTTNWKKKQYESVIAYYGHIHIEYIAQIRNKYRGLTLKQQLFVILQNEGVNQKNIRNILAISEGGYRTIKSRVKNKLVQ